MLDPVIISAAVEGAVDEAVVRRLIAHAGGHPGTVYGKNGKHDLHRKLAGYDNAARHAPWLVLVDLDSDFDCAPLLRQRWLPAPAPLLCFRIAVRQVEAWLMADAEALASFLAVAPSKVPSNPESLPDPKSALVSLARLSRSSDIRQDMVPREGSGRRIGRAYPSRLIEFANQYWTPAEAAKRADSLRRAIGSLERLVEASK